MYCKCIVNVAFKKYNRFLCVHSRLRNNVPYFLKNTNLFFTRLIRRTKITQITIDMSNYFFLNVHTLF